MKLFKLDIQTLVAIVAAVVSVVATVFAWQQTDSAQTHNRVSVSPVLRLTPYAEGPGGRNGLYLFNAGLGPGIITGFSARAKDVEVSGFGSDRWAEILKAAGAAPACFATGWPTKNAAVAANKEEPLLFITRNKDFEHCHMEMIRLMGGAGIQVTVTYRSLYGDVTTETQTSKVQSATIDAAYRTLQQIQPRP